MCNNLRIYKSLLLLICIWCFFYLSYFNKALNTVLVFLVSFFNNSCVACVLGYFSWFRYHEHTKIKGETNCRYASSRAEQFSFRDLRIEKRCLSIYMLGSMRAILLTIFWHLDAFNFLAAANWTEFTLISCLCYPLSVMM